MYLVTRLTGYDFSDVRKLIDRSLQARNVGRVVLDMRNGSDEKGEDWLRDTAIRLPAGRYFLEETAKVVEREKSVIGFASWGSNDPARRERVVGMEWLPGAIMTEYVSTNGRTLERPPEGWKLGTWADRAGWFKESPQTLVADYIREGASGAAGHVFEPYLGFTPRPDHLFPAYLSGRNLAESYYSAIPTISWMTVVIGDPLCRLQ